MVKIELKDGQSGYNAVANYIKRYWEHNVIDTVIISIELSNNGEKFEKHNEIASPIGFDDIEYLYDWWEGEKFINILGIKSINEIEVLDGVYT